MEDTLRVLLNFVMMKVLRCLNPCSNGRYSQSGWNIVDDLGVTS